MTEQNLGFTTNAKPHDFAGEFNAIQYMIRQILGKANIATLVQVQAVTNNGGVSAFGFVDVLPMINLVDGLGNTVPQGQTNLYQLPYVRIQGGANAIILDPQVGDIGIAIIADRDISIIKATQAVGNAGSGRRNNLADGIYIGGILNAAPTQYIQFNSSGITINAQGTVNITSTGKTTITATEIDIVGNGGTAKGIVQADCVCAFTGAPHAMISTTVKGTI
jgi:hypothetical protein